MIEAEKQSFIKIIIGLSAIKPGKALTKEAYEIWWNALREHWSLENFRAAAARLARASEFMPSPFDFDQLRKASRPTAGEAWAEVLEYVRNGWYHWTGSRDITRNLRVPEPPSQLVARAVAALGGYKAIGMTEDDKLPFLERRFCEHYEAIQDAEEVRQELPAIAGPSRLQGDGPQHISRLLTREDA